MNKRQNNNIIIFLPLFCAVLGTLVGVVGYFYLASVPLYTALISTFVAALLYGGLRHHALLTATLILFIALGMLAAAWRTTHLGTIMLDESFTEQRHWVVGTISEVTIKDKTTRLMVNHPKVYGLTPQQTPQKIRISVQASRVKNIKTGDHVSTEAYLQRPNPAKFEGDFDYQRYAYYTGFGAIGQVRGDIYFDTPEAMPPPSLQAKREALANTLYTALGSTQASAVMAALVTGLRNHITEDTADDYRNAGLAHLMAISGFHLGAVGGLIYVLVRFLWAAIPSLAVRYNGKKPAALVGWLGALAYTIIAGGNIPVFRAFIMISAMFLAVWVERRRMALRLLGLAAIMVAWLWPEGVLTASYQMSFMASLALILWAYWHDSHSYHSRHKLMQGITYMKAVWVTSLLAGLATMPFVVWHFQNLTLVGFMANMVAVPLMGLLTTPLTLLGFALGSIIPWGYALWPATITLQWVNSLAHSMAHWPMAQNFVPQEFTLIVLAVVTLLMILVYQRRWRWLAGAGGLALTMLALFTRYDFTPDVVSLDKGDIVVLKIDRNKAFVARNSHNADSKMLLRHYTQHRNWHLVKAPPTHHCDLTGCLYEVHGKNILLPDRGITPDDDDCALSDVVITDPETQRLYCGNTLWRSGGRVSEVYF